MDYLETLPLPKLLRLVDDVKKIKTDMENAKRLRKRGF